MNRLYFIIIFIVLSFNLAAQSLLDSLLHKMDTVRSDTETIDLYYQIAEFLQKSDYKQSIAYAEKGISLSLKSNDTIRRAKGLLIAGKSLSIMGLYNYSLEKFSECYLLIEHLHDSLLMGQLFKNMGSVYWYLQDYDSALVNYQKALPHIISTNDTLLISGVLFNVGLSYTQLNLKDSVLYYMDTAFVLAHQVNDSSLMSHILIHKGGFLIRIGMLDAAEDHLKRALAFEKLTALNMNSLLYSNLALLHIKKHEYKNVDRFLARSKDYAKKSKSLFAAKQAIDIQLIFDSITRNYQSAYTNLNELMQMKDSIATVDFHEKISGFQSIYELKHKESEIKILKSENELYSLKNRQNNVLIGLLTIIFLFALGIIFMIVQSNRQKNRSISVLNSLNIELRTHKEEMIALNEELSMNQAELYEKNIHLENAIARLKTTQNQLIQSEKMASMGILVRGIAHELLNPLNFINGGIVIIQDVCSSTPEIKEASKAPIEMMNEGINRAVTIVHQLSTFVDHGLSEKQPVKLQQIIQNTLVFVKYRFSFDTKLIEEYEEVENFYGYPDKIHTIIFQLLTNALDATETIGNEKVIKVSISSHNYENQSYADISVFNSGKPIDEAIVSKIFDPFFTTKEVNKGTGLGLTIAYNLSKEIQGTLSFENVKGGVQFTVSFPMDFIEPSI